MKKIMLISLAAATMFACKTNETVVERQDALYSKNDSLSYALGVSISTNLNQQGIGDINPQLFMQGMTDQRDSMEMMTAADADQFIRGELMRQKAEAENAAKEDGLAFLEDNKTKEGVITTETGLQYKVIREGDGASPDADDQVTVNYEGMLIDGTIFDSSYQKGEPATFPLNGVIRGWTEGLQTMKVGGKTEFYIPYGLGYGSRGGGGGKIPPFSTLIFTVELLDVQAN